MWDPILEDPCAEIEEREEFTLLREAMIDLFSNGMMNDKEKAVARIVLDKLNGDERTYTKLADQLGCDRSSTGRKVRHLFWSLMKARGYTFDRRKMTYAQFIQTFIGHYVAQIHGQADKHFFP